MARPRFDNLPSERQRAILSVAEGEFAAHGYRGASLNRIIKDAGLSKGVFYYYFDDKADLAATVFEAAARDMIGPLEHLRLPEGDLDFWAFFAAMLRSTAESVRAAPRQTDALYRLGMATATDRRLMARVNAALKGTMRVISRFWQEAQARGAVRDDLPVEVLMAVLQSVKEGLARTMLPADRAPTAREVHHFLDVQIDLYRRLAAKPERRVRPRRRATKEVRS